MGIFNFSKNEQKEEMDNYSNDWGNRPMRDDNSADEVFSVPVKAGKRIYYFDVKATRGDDFYITITESRKKPMSDGTFAIDKHKLHLYKEDFAKFADGFSQVVEYVKKHKPEFFENEANNSYND